MRLVDCYTISDKRFSEVARRFPQLEKVDISLCCITSVSLEVLGRSCPLLKSLEFGKSNSLVKSRFVYCKIKVTCKIKVACKIDFDYIWMDFDPSRALVFDPSDSSDFDP